MLTKRHRIDDQATSNARQEEPSIDSTAMKESSIFGAEGMNRSESKGPGCAPISMELQD